MSAGYYSAVLGQNDVARGLPYAKFALEIAQRSIPATGWQGWLSKYYPYLFVLMAPRRRAKHSPGLARRAGCARSALP